MIPRITLDDGSRYPCDPLPKGTTEARAREVAGHKSERAAIEHWVRTEEPRRPVDPVREAQSASRACQQWVDTWQADREARGLTGAAEGKGHWKNHIKAVLGSKHPKDWTRDDFRRLSAALDEKVQQQLFSWRMARLVWGTSTKMADDAQNSNLDSIRCRDDNPSVKVRGPKRGTVKVRAYLYPSEFLTLMQCTMVPLHWRRRIALAIYLGVRTAELDAFDWSAFDMTHGIVSIYQAMDRSKKGKTKSTKGKRARRFKLDENLIPLLTAMISESGGKGRLFPQLNNTGNAKRFREFLKRAGVDRAELHCGAKDPNRKQITWHDLRATTSTWMAIRGDRSQKIMDRLGHANIATTQIYIREAEQLIGSGFGEVFPPLPSTLF